MVIVAAGIWYLADGHTEHWEQPFSGGHKEPGFIALAFYSGLFSYSGWNYLNFVTEELKDPYRNLPRAICISMPVVTVIYMVTNIAYFSVLSTDEILSSEAVAVTFGDKMLGFLSWIMPIAVACATFGSLNGAIFCLIPIVLRWSTQWTLACCHLFDKHQLPNPGAGFNIPGENVPVLFFESELIFYRSLSFLSVLLRSCCSSSATYTRSSTM